MESQVQFQKSGESQQAFFYNPFSGQRQGSLVAPGTFTVEMHLYKDGAMQPLTNPVAFKVRALNNTVLPAEDRKAKVAFQRETAALSADLQTCRRMISEMNTKIKHIKEAIKLAEIPLADLSNAVRDLESKIREANNRMGGDPVRRRLDIGQPPSPSRRIGRINREQKYLTSAPTQTHLDSYAIAKQEYIPIEQMVRKLYREDMIRLEQMLEDAGAPYTPGRVLRQRN